MNAPVLGFALAIDLRTLMVIAAWMAALLGMFLLLAWISDRASRALAWWSTAYIIGGSAVASWVSGHASAFPAAKEIPGALLFLALGMIWTGARLFYGRRIRPLALIAGAVIWLVATQWPAFAVDGGGRLLLSAVGIASYTFLTSFEVWYDRRKQPYPRWRAIVVPLLHASVFLCPVILPTVMPWAIGATSDTWRTALTLATLLYAVGTAFVILSLVHDRTVRMHRDAASTDTLTGLFNRRGFLECAQRMIGEHARSRQPVTLLMFDLDHFKSINDRFGHAVGDEVLELFARIASANMRMHDVIGRLGGEEFAAVVPGDADVAVGIAERVREAFQAAGVDIAGCRLNATVSIGAAWTVEDVPAALVLAQADAALYRAKALGRNRLELAVAPVCPPEPGRDLAAGAVAGRGRRRFRDAALDAGAANRWMVAGRDLVDAVVAVPVTIQRDEQVIVADRRPLAVP
jgi:diguanylate cyclase (GGDEF)-like protein